MTFSVPTSSSESGNRQSKPSLFSPIKIATLIATVLLVSLVVVCAFAFANSGERTINLASNKLPSSDSRSASMASSGSGRNIAQDGKLGEATGRFSASVSSGSLRGGSSAADEDVSRLGAVRRFFFGTRTRKVVFSAAVAVLVLLVAFVVVYFTVIARPSAGADGADSSGGGGSKIPPGGNAPLTPQQQAKLEVSHMMAADPAKVYGPVFGTISGIFAIVAGTVILGCSKVEIKSHDEIGGALRKNLRGSRLLVVAICLIVVLALIAVPLGLYFGDSQAFWTVVYAMTYSTPSLPVVLIFILFALWSTALFFFGFVLWRCKRAEKKIGVGIFQQLMYWTNHTRPDYHSGTFKRARRILIVKLVFLLVATAGCCIGLAYAVAHLDDIRMLCAVSISCLGVLIICGLALSFNRLFSRFNRCSEFVMRCEGQPGPGYNTIDYKLMDE